MSNVTINKIKYQESSGKLTIEYMRTNENKKPSYHTSIFNDEPAPEFFTALKNLTKPTLNILGLGALLIKRIKPYAVSFKYAEDKTMSAVISSMFYVPSADREIVVNTPLMKCPADEVEASQAGFFNQEAVDSLWAFEQEARKYLDGKRNQISLFGEDTEAETAVSDVSAVGVPKPNNVVQMPTVAQ